MKIESLGSPRWLCAQLGFCRSSALLSSPQEVRTAPFLLLLMNDLLLRKQLPSSAPRCHRSKFPFWPRHILFQAGGGGRSLLASLCPTDHDDCSPSCGGPAVPRSRMTTSASGLAACLLTPTVFSSSSRRSDTSTLTSFTTCPNPHPILNFGPSSLSVGPRLLLGVFLASWLLR